MNLEIIEYGAADQIILPMRLVERGVILVRIEVAIGLAKFTAEEALVVLVVVEKAQVLDRLHQATLDGVLGHMQIFRHVVDLELVARADRRRVHFFLA